MKFTASLVVTTIHDPVALENYFKNFQRYGYLEQVQVYVIPDRKTPSQAHERCQDLNRRGLKVICPSLEEQESYLKRIGFPPHLIPYDSDNRRNIGYLMALESGSDFVISIDDDNYCRSDEDFFLEHSAVCEHNHSAEIVDTNTGWFNICNMLELDRPYTTYPRGFPYYVRHAEENPVITSGRANIHINTGLWLLDPDLDGITWLVAPAHVMSFKGKSLILGEKAWSPINTQNTALRRDAIAGYYFVKMGYLLGGMPIDRYGDIFSGYFVQVCVRHMGGAVRVGTPVADHRRNSHNYIKDAANEWACIMVLEDLLPWLIEVELEGSTYPEVYESLSHAIEEAVEHFSGGIWTDVMRSYFHQVAFYMRLWARACCRIGV